jgi:hypothetical protein
METLGKFFFAAPDLTILAHSFLTLVPDSTVSHSTFRKSRGEVVMTRQNLMETEEREGQNLIKKSLVALT